MTLCPPARTEGAEKFLGGGCRGYCLKLSLILFPSFLLCLLLSSGQDIKDSLLIYLVSNYYINMASLFWQSLLVFLLFPEKDRKGSGGSLCSLLSLWWRASLYFGSCCCFLHVFPSVHSLPPQWISLPVRAPPLSHWTAWPVSMSITLCPHCPSLRYLLQWGPTAPTPSHLFTVFIGHIDTIFTVCSVKKKSCFLRNSVAPTRKTSL